MNQSPDTLTRLPEEIEQKQLLPEEQFGFTAKHSTELQPVPLLVEHISEGMEERKSTSAIFFDVS